MTARGGVSWSYKFFWCLKSGNRWVVRYQIKNTNFWLPRSFVWTLGDDPDTLKVYIDALILRNKTVTTMWEQNGTAIDHEMQPEPEGGVVRLDHMKLAAFLRGEYVLEVPAYGRILLSGSGHQASVFMPQDIQASLLADRGPLHELYMQKLQQMVGTGVPIVALEKEKFKDGVVKVQAYNPGAAIAVAPEKEAEAAAPAPVHAEEEIEVARFDHDGYLETIFSRGEYFVRRLNALDQTPFWAGSSYSAHGPWEQFFVNQPLYDALMQHEAAV